MLKLEKGYKLSINKAEKDVTKQGVEYLKVSGKVYTKLVPFASEKSILAPNYFGKVLIFGDEEYLEEVQKRVWALDNQEVKENSVAIKLDEAYIYNVYMREQRRLISMLIVAQSDFVKNKFKNKYSETPLIANYYLSPYVKNDKTKEETTIKILLPETTDKPKGKRGRPKKEKVEKEVVVETPSMVEAVEKTLEEPTKSDFLSDFLNSIGK